jgi:hypothetical protein
MYKFSWNSLFWVIPLTVYNYFYSLVSLSNSKLQSINKFSISKNIFEIVTAILIVTYIVKSHIIILQH